MKNGTIKLQVYESSESGYKASGQEEATLEKMSSGLLQDNLEEAALRKAFLKGNPFFYHPETAYFKVHSIEDYIVNYKKKEVTFGDVIHHLQYPLKKKRKFVKKTFRFWNREFIKKKKEVIQTNTSMVNVIGEIEYLGINLISKIMMYLGFILLLLFVNTNTPIWKIISKTGFGLKMLGFLQSAYQSANWVNIIGLSGLYVLFLLIVYTTIHNVILSDYRKSYSYVKTTLERSKKKINKEYKKKYMKIRNYYLKQVSKKKQFFESILMEQVSLSKVNLDYFSELTQKIVGKANKLKNTKFIYVLTKATLMFLCIASGALVIGYLLYFFVRTLL